MDQRLGNENLLTPGWEVLNVFRRSLKLVEYCKTCKTYIAYCGQIDLSQCVKLECKYAYLGWIWFSILKIIKQK